jgi:hypothetical protein
MEKLVVIAKNDSLLRLVQDENWLLEKIKLAKRKEKEDAERAKALAERNQNTPPTNAFPGNSGMPMNPMMNGGNGSGSSFPFYNVVTRKNGITEFKRMFGERPNTDFWKYASKMQTANSNDKQSEKSIDTTVKDGSRPKEGKNLSEKLKNVSDEDRKYYQNLPLEQAEQESLLREIETALFESAEIYATKLNEYETAFDQNSRLLNRFSTSAYVPQTYYEIVKLQRLLNHPSLVKIYTDTLKQKFPESVYVRMLDNPESIHSAKSTQTESNETIQLLYDSMISYLQQKDFQRAVQIKLNADKSYSGNSLQPRFDYVYGLCLLQTDSFKAVETFKQLTLDYPNTDVSDRAKNLLIALEKRRTDALPDSIKNQLTAPDAYQIPAANEALDAILILPKESNVNMVKALVSDLHKKEFSMDAMVIGRHIPIKEKYLVIIENFNGQDKTKFYTRYMSQQQDLFNSRGIFNYQILPISKDNLQKLVKSQDIQGYIHWYEKQHN